MDCIVLAGGIPEEGDSLFECTQGRPKALVDIGGKPMAQWVLDALTAAQEIARIVLVGLGPEDGLSSSKLVAFVPDQGTLVDNSLAGVERLLEIDPAAQQVVISSSDIPSIAPEMVSTLIGQCADPSIDIYYPIVARTLMEGRFPGSRRSYVHLVDGDFAGADIFVINPRVTLANRELLEGLAGSRKQALKQARQIGLIPLLKLLLRRLSLAEAEARVSKAIELRGRAVIVKHAELGMDVDKPFQLEICRRALADR